MRWTSLVEDWFIRHQRSFPWRLNRTPFRVWVSEIMLQQTQTQQVVDYFSRFISRFPRVEDVAQAQMDEVLSLWSGLGYYSRARQLHRTAQRIVADFQGEFPSDHAVLSTLPGIGSYTAGAICAFAFEKAAPVVDGNISRVFSRYLGDETLINTAAGKKHFEAISLELVQQSHRVLLLQEGLMELGATVCLPKNPHCSLCPLQHTCFAYRHQSIPQFPQKTAPKARTPLSMVSAILHSKNEIWLERRSEKGLFGGLYEPPSLCMGESENPSEVLARILTERDLAFPLQMQSPIVVKRVLTHRDLTWTGFLIEIPKEKHPGAHWFEKNLMSHMGLSSAVRALLQQAFLEV